ncbi:hypothetical protein VDP36_16805 [Xanthomonas campestris pv. campestris]|nr:hypothetical protein [Xanthomonas campestris pv. campestris]MEB2042758.1 hypothetical protein [Xanthomonas campestris pv. campestris]
MTMRQIAIPLHPSIPGCHAGHHPQWVETHGAPMRLRTRLGTPVPVTYHIQCARCGVATRPTHLRSLVENRWTDPLGLQRVPLSLIGRAREEALAAINQAAHAA